MQDSSGCNRIKSETIQQLRDRRKLVDSLDENFKARDTENATQAFSGTTQVIAMPKEAVVRWLRWWGIGIVPIMLFSSASSWATC